MQKLIKNERKWVMLKTTLETMFESNNYSLSSLSETVIFQGYIKELIKKMDEIEIQTMFKKEYDLEKEWQNIKTIVDIDVEGKDTLVSQSEYIWKKEIAKKIKKALELIEKK